MPPDEPPAERESDEQEARKHLEERAVVRATRLELTEIEEVEPATEPETDIELAERPTGLRMYRPAAGGLEPAPVEHQTWRSDLRSRRWKPAALANPEMTETSSRVAVAFWLVLALVTFVGLLIGYGTGLWG